LRAALAEQGFDAGEFAPFFEAYAAYAALDPSAPIDEPVRRLQARLAGPPALLLHVGRQQVWFMTLITDPPVEPPPRETNTVAASQLQSLNRLLFSYRQSLVRLSLAGLAVVGLGVMLTYGWRDGGRIFAIPCGTCLGIFGMLGWVGQPLKATSIYRGEPPPASVRLSALTTAASFGVLAASAIPVVRALGVTVSAIVLAALLVIELEHLAPLGRKA
jgi:hypothetical protein